MKPKKSEHTSITGKSFYGTPAEFYLASALPFGRWTCADGREILFNGFEEPLWQRRPGAEATPADPHARVPKIVCTERIYYALSASIVMNIGTTRSATPPSYGFRTSKLACGSPSLLKAGSGPGRQHSRSSRASAAGDGHERP